MSDPIDFGSLSDEALIAIDIFWADSFAASGAIGAVSLRRWRATLKQLEHRGLVTIASGSLDDIASANILRHYEQLQP